MTYHALFTYLAIAIIVAIVLVALWRLVRLLRGMTKQNQQKKPAEPPSPADPKKKWWTIDFSKWFPSTTSESSGGGIIVLAFLLAHVVALGTPQISDFFWKLIWERPYLVGTFEVLCLILWLLYPKLGATKHIIAGVCIAIVSLGLLIYLVGLGGVSSVDMATWSIKVIGKLDDAIPKSVGPTMRPTGQPAPTSTEPEKIPLVQNIPSMTLGTWEWIVGSERKGFRIPLMATFTLTWDDALTLYIVHRNGLSETIELEAGHCPKPEEKHCSFPQDVQYLALSTKNGNTTTVQVTIDNPQRGTRR